MANRQNWHYKQRNYNDRHKKRFNDRLSQSFNDNYLSNPSSSYQPIPSNRALFPGYARNDNRPRPLGFRADSFCNTYADLERENAIKRMSDEIKELKKKNQETVRLFQEQLPEGQKRIGVCDDSDDEEDGDYDAPVVVIFFI